MIKCDNLLQSGVCQIIQCDNPLHFNLTIDNRLQEEKVSYNIVMFERW